MSRFQTAIGLTGECGRYPLAVAFLAASTALALCAGLGAPARAADLAVTITGLPDASGHVRIGVCERSEFLGEHCRYHTIVSARPGSLTATIHGIDPGIYAVAAYQDSTDTGRLRRGLFGIPKDPTGFSRNPTLTMGPPSFDRCAFRIGTGNAAISIALHAF